MTKEALSELRDKELLAICAVLELKVHPRTGKQKLIDQIFTDVQVRNEKG